MRLNAEPIDVIAVHRPVLPTAAMLSPYLDRIDANRWYTNMGPLAVELARRLDEHFVCADGSIHLVANATLGLALCLMTSCGEGGGLCMQPAWTFVATAHATRQAGLTPWLVDVDADTQQLTPMMARALLADPPGPVRAIVVVSPHGCPVDWDGWLALRRETGIPVIIDAAAGFDSLRVTELPTVVSLHATKIFGVGEGGLVCCADADFMDQIVRRSNFGFLGSREALVVGTNAKFSEYHAAVGLAALDHWPATRAQFAAVQSHLHAALSGIAGVVCPGGGGWSWVSSSFCVQVDFPLAPLMHGLQEQGIETRRWWGDGVHRHPAFAGCPRQDLANTDFLAKRVLGLPCSRDQSPGDSDRVCAALRRILG
ncbi:MAG: DegT/DnrJ/EryC1/StrS family aminotransferase [Magnetospirillum gryphiswaldense]|nr:DegT/DnrJ/EryC1/StrS family aminotransferase [Magnetospirillum gryphiswaldense]